VVDPTAGCRVQQTCELPRDQVFGPGLAAEQTVEAGRNGKDGTSSRPGSLEPKDERRFIREWTQRQSCRRRGRIDEPHERSPPAGNDLRIALGGRDRANRCVSLKRRHDEVSTHHWSAPRKGDKGQTSHLFQGAGDDARSFGCAVKSPPSFAVPTSERPPHPEMGTAPGS